MAAAMRWASLSRCSASAPSAAAAAAQHQFATIRSNGIQASRRGILPSLWTTDFVSPGSEKCARGPWRPYSGSSRKSDGNAVRQLVVTRASSKAEHGEAAEGKAANNVRVRFAPSPTGNLHVGGARTALFNYLFAKVKGGKFILRIEDTDLERSTRESEEAVLRDLEWLGLEYDEGPGKGGEYGPYRQSERTHVYKEYADKLLKTGKVYRCFCSDEELEAQREEAKAKNLPPRYMGKWGTASQAEVDAELAKGTPFTYRFRVPQEGSITINDLIRGEVSWSKETLGDFVVLRSNGQPVYNFCVAVDDATMKITHVLRGEEHLPNTLRQALIYGALNFPMPQFAHVSLLLATDRSKLSKRHGATSVGQFKEMGYLSQAMVNFLALLGWNDGSEDEIFTVEQIIEKFSVDRITKSSAIFDIAKLGWMNGQHLRALPLEAKSEMLGKHWLRAGILKESEGPFVTRATELIQNAIDIVSDGDAALLNILVYPLHATLVSEPAKEFIDDNLSEIATAVIDAYHSGALQAAADGGHDTWKKFVNGIGKSQKRKGKRLFMPLRIALTGRMQGPDMGSVLCLLKEGESSGVVTTVGGLIPLAERMQFLEKVDWSATPLALPVSAPSAESSPVLTH